MLRVGFSRKTNNEKNVSRQHRGQASSATKHRQHQKYGQRRRRQHSQARAAPAQKQSSEGKQRRRSAVTHQLWSKAAVRFKRRHIATWANYVSKTGRPMVQHRCSMPAATAQQESGKSAARAQHGHNKGEVLEQQERV